MADIVLNTFTGSSKALLDSITNYCDENSESILNSFAKFTPNLEKMTLEDSTLQVGEIGRNVLKVTNTDIFFRVTTQVVLTSKINDPIEAMAEINRATNELIYLIFTEKELKKFQFSYEEDEYYHTVEEGIKARAITLHSQEGYSIELLPKLLCPDYNLDVKLKVKKE